MSDDTRDPNEALYKMLEMQAPPYTVPAEDALSRHEITQSHRLERARILQGLLLMVPSDYHEHIIAATLKCEAWAQHEHQDMSASWYLSMLKAYAQGLDHRPKEAEGIDIEAPATMH